MEDQTSVIGALFEKTEHYTRTTLELQKLKAIDKSADVLSTLAVYAILIFIVCLCFLVLSIGIAFWVNEMMGSNYLGFFIVAGGQAVIGLILYLCRNKWIKMPIRNIIVTEAMS